MPQIPYLNLGCGDKFHKDWVNIDMVSTTPYVKAVNLLKGIPYPANEFEVVYHSQVLEHIPKQEAQAFLSDCCRVLKPGGTLRIVLPDLEDIARNYIKLLDQNLENTTPESKANYEWMLLEMYDQAIRNIPGGMMTDFISQQEMANEDFVLDRIGHIGKNIRKGFLGLPIDRPSVQELTKESFLTRAIRRIKKELAAFRRGIINLMLTQKERNALKVGEFRLGGEIHYWMYDRYSLKELLLASGFKEVFLMSPHKSNIPDWASYELDVRANGDVYDPTSLFMEARK